MVGPCGLEPQTSTVSIWRPHDYQPLLKATKCKCVNEMASLWFFHDSQSHVVNFGAKTRSMLNCVFNFPATGCAFNIGCTGVKRTDLSRHSLCRRSRASGYYLCPPGCKTIDFLAGPRTL